MVGSQLAAILNLSEDRDDGDVSLAIVGLVTSAVHDESPAHSLREIYSLVTSNGGGPLLDPLNLVPLLVPVCACVDSGVGNTDTEKEREREREKEKSNAARDLLGLMGECANPREVVVAVQEGVEKVRRGVENEGDGEDEDDDEGEEGDEENGGKTNERTRSKWVDQALVLVDLYRAAISRLKLRRNKSPSETIGPLLEELGGMIISVVVGSRGGGEGMDEVLEGVNELVGKVRVWVDDNVGGEGQSEDEKVKSYTLLRNLLETTIEACISTPSIRLGPGKAQNTFQALFPRLVVPRPNSGSGSGVDPKEEQQKRWEGIMLGVVEEYARLGGAVPTSTAGTPSRASLVLLAYSDLDLIAGGDLTKLERILEGYMPVIIASLQTNFALEETLSVLLSAFYRFCYPTSPTGQSTTSTTTTSLALPISRSLSHIGRREVSPQTTIPLTTILPLVASTHPDGDVRYVTFKVLGMVVRCVGPVNLRVEVLRELVGGSSADAHSGSSGGRADGEEEETMVPPGMRVAAVGLVREILLEGLAMTEPNLMASPVFLKVFGPVLFKHRLVELSGGLTDGGLKELLEKCGEEPARVTECLLLLYVLIVRDVGNKTGVRDPDNIRNLQKEFLDPLRGVLEKWEGYVPGGLVGGGFGLGGSSHGHDHDHDHDHDDEEHKILLTVVVPLKLALERVDDVIAGVNGVVV